MAWILPYAAVSWEDVSGSVLILVVAFVLAGLTSHVMRRAERGLGAARGPAALDAAGRTRLRFLRRLASASIIGVGVFLALIQFEAFDQLAGAVLASGAVATAVLGFAARETLGNVISGIMIALTQPIRVGDQIAIGDVTGKVEDLTLTFTWLRTPDGSRHLIPNQLITTQPVRNDSVREHVIAPAATVWIDPGADEAAAVRVLLGVADATSASVDEVTPDGVRLRVSADPVDAEQRGLAEARLRAGALQALREAGISRAGAG